MGEYSLASLSHYKSAPKFSFTSAPAVKDKKANMPGPGNYPPTPTDLDKFRRSSSWSMGSTSNMGSGKEWSKLPGPGAYTLPGLGATGPKWAFSTDDRLRERKKSCTPAPGTYETRPKKSGLEMSICSKPEGAKPAKMPGPGAYKVSEDKLSKFSSTPSVSFGAATKRELKPSPTPGPGAYAQKGSLGGSSYSIKGRYEPPKPFVTPGPGTAGSSFK
jgi:hypothetical protein